MSGAPRVFVGLPEAGETCSKNRVARLMREYGPRALHGYRTRSWVIGKPTVLTPHVLKRQFTVTKPNIEWAKDITNIRTWHGWLYLPVIVELLSLKVVGWAANSTLHRELVLSALLVAGRQCRPRVTLILSDQATEFISQAWRHICRPNRREPSMSHDGNCWDNAVADSSFSSLKKEWIKEQINSSRELAHADVSGYIEDLDSRIRRHSYRGGLSLGQNEAAHTSSRRGVREGQGIPKIWQSATS